MGRRKALKTLVKETPGKLQFAIGRDFEELNEEEIQAFLDESIAGSCEGLMLKTLNDNGAYGAFLLAIWNNEEEEFQTVCKAGTGFSDEDLKTHYEFFKDKTIPAAENT